MTLNFQTKIFDVKSSTKICGNRSKDMGPASLSLMLYAVYKMWDSFQETSSPPMLHDYSEEWWDSFMEGMTTNIQKHILSHFGRFLHRKKSL